MRWIKVCHAFNLSVQDYHRYRQLISRLPYTQSPWGPETSSKGIVEISVQLQIELGRESLYNLFSFSPFFFEIWTHLSHFEVILLTCITFFFFLLCNVNVHFSNIKPLIWAAPPEHSIEAGNHFYIRLCHVERKTTLAWKRLEISHLEALSVLLSLNTLLRGVKRLEQNLNYSVLPQPWLSHCSHHNLMKFWDFKHSWTGLTDSSFNWKSNIYFWFSITTPNLQFLNHIQQWSGGGNDGEKTSLILLFSH